MDRVGQSGNHIHTSSVSILLEEFLQHQEAAVPSRILRDSALCIVAHFDVDDSSYLYCNECALGSNVNATPLFVAARRQSMGAAWMERALQRDEILKVFQPKSNFCTFCVAITSNAPGFLACKRTLSLF